MRKIVVKELKKSSNLTGAESEFIIYLDVDDTGLHAMAYLEIGEEAKNVRVAELLLKYFVSKNDGKLIHDNIIIEKK